MVGGERGAGKKAGNQSCSTRPSTHFLFQIQTSPHNRTTSERSVSVILPETKATMRVIYLAFVAVGLFLPTATKATLSSSQFGKAHVSTFRIHRHDEPSTGPALDQLNGDDQLPNKREIAARLAFLHRCGALVSSVSQTHHSAVVSRNVQSETINCDALDSVLSIRGGASTNGVQNILRSILDSPLLPSSLKKVIEMICKFLENLTGWSVLPQKSVVKKSKAGKLKAKEVLVEEVSSGRRSTKSQSKSRKSVQKVRTEPSETKQASSSKTSKDLQEESTDSETTTPTKTIDTPSNTEPTPKSSPTTKSQHPDAASKKFLSNNLKSSNPNYRIQRELKEFISSPPPGLTVKISGKNVRLWIITFNMPENTIYASETYKLRVQFPNDYPTSPPSVYFLPPTPRHEHVYTNGDICLSLLGKDWRPIMTAQSVAQAIFSILCGAQRKSLPMDNSRHAGNKPGQRQDDWVYHDDNC